MGKKETHITEGSVCSRKGLFELGIGVVSEIHAGHCLFASLQCPDEVVKVSLDNLELVRNKIPENALLPDLKETLIQRDQELYDLKMAFFEKSNKKRKKKDIVQVLILESDRYIKIDRTTGNVISRKKTTGPYKNVTIIEGESDEKV